MTQTRGEEFKEDLRKAEATGKLIRPLDDTAPHLRAAARQDLWFVVGFDVLAPLLAFAWGGLSGLTAARSNRTHDLMFAPQETS